MCGPVYVQMAVTVAVANFRTQSSGSRCIDAQTYSADKDRIVVCGKWKEWRRTLGLTQKLNMTEYGAGKGVFVLPGVQTISKQRYCSESLMSILFSVAQGDSSGF